MSLLPPSASLHMMTLNAPYLVAPPIPINVTTMKRKHTQFSPIPGLFTYAQAKLTPQVRSPSNHQQKPSKRDLLQESTQ